MNRLSELWRGEVKLWKTFWFFGIAVPMLAPFTLALFLANIFQKAPSFILLSDYFLPFIFITYELVIIVAIWRSANNYQGTKIWPVLGKIVSIIVAAVMFANIIFTRIDFWKNFNWDNIKAMTDDVDHERNSLNINKFLKPDKDFPYIGFWKEQSSDNYGLAIDKTAEGKYVVIFCGPGGCDKPDSRKAITLIDDPAYKIIDGNTIEKRDLLGSTKYFRVGKSGRIMHKCDPEKDSSILQKPPKPDKDFPFMGVWKQDCCFKHGLAIDNTADGKYSVSFCTSGRCSEPGKYKPNTRLVGDPDYHIIDANTIDVQEIQGFFTRYYRCGK